MGTVVLRVRGGSMKKLLVLAILAGSVVVPNSATADGTCTPKSLLPIPSYSGSTSTIHYRGKISCTEKHLIYVEASLYRRSPGGTLGWQWQEDAFEGPTLAYQVVAGGHDSPYRCEKDYKVVTVGFATNYGEPGSHGTASNPLKDTGGGNILSATC